MNTSYNVSKIYAYGRGVIGDVFMLSTRLQISKDIDPDFSLRKERLWSLSETFHIVDLAVRNIDSKGDV